MECSVNSSRTLLAETYYVWNCPMYNITGIKQCCLLYIFTIMLFIATINSDLLF